MKADIKLLREECSKSEKQRQVDKHQTNEPTLGLFSVDKIHTDERKHVKY